MRVKYIAKRLAAIAVFAYIALVTVLLLSADVIPNYMVSIKTRLQGLQRGLQRGLQSTSDLVAPLPSCVTCCYRYIHCLNSTKCGNNTFVKANLPDDEFKKRQCMRRLPGAIIIGTKKSGTSALQTFLGFHPEIAAADGEPHFFNRPVYHYGETFYKKMMPLSSKQQITLEKTPIYYAYHPLGVHRRVHRLLPHAKLIIILRDPIKRAISDYFMETRYLLASGGKLSPKRLEPLHGYDLGDTFEKSVLTAAGGKVNPQSKFVSLSVYNNSLAHWLSVFPRSSLLAIDGDAFVKDPLPVLKETERFLGVQSFFDEDSFFTEENRGFRCLAKPVRTCWKSVKRPPHPTIPEDVLQKLKKFYEPYNRSLVKLLNQTFEWIK